MDALPHSPGYRQLSLAITFSFLLAVPLSGLPAYADVTVTILDVGQGDATLVQSSSGQTLLFDGGNNGKGNSVVIPFLNSQGITTLDYMVASHYHADHVGGLDEVYNAVGVNEAVYDRGWSYTTYTYDDYEDAVFLQRQTMLDDQVIDLGDGVTVTCLALNGNGELASPFDTPGLENEYCLALLVECGDFDFFQAGDLTGGGGSSEDIESSLAAEVGEIEVYRVNHHGSYTSSNAYFLGALLPEVAIISVGNNSYGHPHQSVLDRLQSYGMHVYQTETGSGGSLPSADWTIADGHVTISTDGSGEYLVNGNQWAMDEPTVDVFTPALAGLQLEGNYPNPFNPTTTIRFSTEHGGPARLLVHDLGGRLVYVDSFQAIAGRQETRWRGRDRYASPVPSGWYRYTVETPAGTGSGTMVLIR